MTVKNVVNVKTKGAGAKSKGSGNTAAYQLGIKFTGSAQLNYKAHKINFTPGTVVYLPKEKTENIDYTTVISEQGNGVCIFFDANQALPDEPQILQNINPEIENAFLRLLDCYVRADKYSYPDIMAAFYSLLSQLNKINLSSGDTVAAKSRFQPAIEHIEKHWDHEYLDITYLSLLCGMSEKYFRDAFKKNFHMAPLQFFHQQKIYNIRNLITNLEYSIADIARMSGFSSANYFSRFFKKHFSISPIQYRNYYCKRL
ncbi:MAG: helix-turn-helix transcriptional regulator [Clostridia bacterium]|nr:helix-turn-helix transcriptional regulator [Clostridia bacterium]